MGNPISTSISISFNKLVSPCWNFAGSISISFNKLVSPCWNFAVKQQKYACEVGKNVEALNNDWVDLTRIRNDIRIRVDNEERQYKKRLKQVDDWLIKVDGLEAEVNELTRDAPPLQGNANKCLGFKSNYKLGKKLDKKLREVAILTSNGKKFDVVAVPVEERPSEPTSGSSFFHAYN